jgi:dienelactone hydrolase
LRERAPRPIWFGPATEPLAGFLHIPPDGSFRGGVLICPPFGYEATCAYRSLRELATSLADSGLLVLRFDYFGTGGSSGRVEDVTGLDTWRASVAAGVAELRRRGIARPGIVGLRLGAALAYGAATVDEDLGPLVMWAPVTSGRSYFRELRAQAAVTPGGVVGDGGLNAYGSRISRPLLAELKTWQPLRAAALAREILVVQSPGWRGVEETADDLLRAGVEYAYLEHDGLGRLLESDAEMARVPVELLSSIHDWLLPRATGSVTGASVRDDPGRLVDTDSAGVEEHIVEIGAAGLYGVVTAPVGQTPRRGVLFLNNGVAPAAGPGRAWVEFARSLAAEGVCSLRIDFSGIGDSPDRTRRDRAGDRAYSAVAADELMAAVGSLRSSGVAEVIVVGLCSGAATALRTAARRNGIDAVFAVNPALYNQPGIGLGRRWWPLPALIGWAMTKRRLRTPALRLPLWWWTLLDRLGMYAMPVTILDDAAARGTRVTLIFSPGDASLADFLGRGGLTPDRAERTDAARVTVLHGLDHSMFDRAGRNQVFVQLSRELTAGLPT